MIHKVQLLVNSRSLSSFVYRHAILFAARRSIGHALAVIKLSDI